MTLPVGPVQAFDVDLRGLPGLPPVEGGRARVLVRSHGAPVTVCVVDVPPEGLEAAQLAQRLADLFAPAAGTENVDLARRARRSELAERGPTMTVQIATRDRPDPLRRCLDSIACADYRAFDIVVIDNAPATDETRAVVRAWEQAHPEVAVRYLREPVPGAARAHNRGLEVATGDWVVRTDDDVVVDPQWLAAIADAATSAPDVQCVTGLILPAEIDTPAQELLEQFGGYARGFRRRHVDKAAHRPDDPLFPFTTGRLGSGANIAFAAEQLRARGGFDIALGPGTPAKGGEDLLALFDVLTGGGGVVYEPSALVWHWNRRDYASLQRLMHDYGVGLSAYLTAAALREPRLAVGMAGKAALGVRHVLGRSSPKNSAKTRDYPRELERRELRGMLAGPAAYVAGRLTRTPERPVVAGAERSREVAR
ncbi:MAG: glycosyltransferase [Pseudonocardiales bacterium]|nr:glycosyltransferase [Pseudonocardiales bacterium]